MNVIFDIETGPLPIERIKEILPPFDPESLGNPPGEFDPKSVKTGNLKDDVLPHIMVTECPRAIKRCDNS